MYNAVLSLLVIINKQVIGDLPAQNSCTFEVFFRTFDFQALTA